MGHGATAQMPRTPGRSHRHESDEGEQTTPPQSRERLRQGSTVAAPPGWVSGSPRFRRGPLRREGWAGHNRTTPRCPGARPRNPLQRLPNCRRCLPPAIVAIETSVPLQCETVQIVKPGVAPDASARSARARLGGNAHRASVAVHGHISRHDPLLRASGSAASPASQFWSPPHVWTRALAATAVHTEGASSWIRTGGRCLAPDACNARPTLLRVGAGNRVTTSGCGKSETDRPAAPRTVVGRNG